MEFPDFSLTLPISKIFPDFLKKFPDFSLTLKNFGFSLTVATLSMKNGCQMQ